MSLLTAVEEAIKSCKAEQARINEHILLHKEILQLIVPQPQKDTRDSQYADDAATDTDISPGEKEEIEFLERALEKALRVRTGIEPSKKNHDRDQQSLKEPGGIDVKPKKVAQTSAVLKGNQTTIRSTTKATSLDREKHKKLGMSELTKLGSRTGIGHHPGCNKSTVKSTLIKKHPVSSADIVHRQVDRKAQQAVSNSGSLDHVHNSTLNSNYNSTGSSVEDLGKAATTPTPCENNAEVLSHSEKTGKQHLSHHNRIPLELAGKWKSLISRQNRLWDKVMAVQRKPVPGRSHFMERMKATFPEDLACGSPNQTRAPVDRLTYQGQDLIQNFQTAELLSKQAVEAGTEPAWEAWSQWRAEGGCLCLAGAKGDGTVAPLPLTITYTTEAELRELEKMRMRMALLHQEISLEQALWDTLSPQLSSVICGPESPNPSVLRDIYSLLGEGGQKFPAIVLDTEPD